MKNFSSVFKRVLSLLAITVGLSLSALNLTSAQSKHTRPKIGLVLKGGGALGFAHVGVLKVLEQNKIPVDMIAGTSMGSIVGAAYASGATVEHMEKVLSSTDWDVLFGEQLDRRDISYRLKAGRQRELYGDVKLSFQDGNFVAPMGVVEGQNIRPLFQKLFGNPSTPIKFDDLPIPFRAVTTDLETGEIYVPDSGDLTTAVRASMSIPGAFSPVEIDGRLLVDGGLADNTPIDVALKMGADILIVVDLQSQIAKRKDLTSIFSISGQMIAMLMMQNSALSMKLLRPHDIVVSPDVNAYAVTDFAKATEIMAIGEKSAEVMVPSLKSLSISSEEYKAFVAKRENRSTLPEKIEFVRIKNESRLSDARIAEQITIKTGDDFDVNELEENIQKLYQTGYFSSVKYSIVKEGNQDGVLIDAQGRDWLAQYVRLGFSLEDNLSGDDSFRLGAAFRTTGVTTKDSYLEAQAEIGKTPRFMLELYQPLSGDSPYFVDPKLSIMRNSITLSEHGDDIAKYERTDEIATLLFGREIGTLGEAFIGVNRGIGQLDLDIGDPSLPNSNYNVGNFVAGFDLDALDRPDFPTTGYRFFNQFLAATDGLGSPNNYQDMTGLLSLPYTFGQNTLILRNLYATTFGQRDIEQSYSLGGFLNVSGTSQSSLTASNFNTGSIIFFRQFSEVANPFFNLASYGGFSYELT